jgi:hypothetical protein
MGKPEHRRGIVARFQPKRTGVQKRKPLRRLRKVASRLLASNETVIRIIRSVTPDIQPVRELAPVTTSANAIRAYLVRLFTEIYKKI